MKNILSTILFSAGILTSVTAQLTIPKASPMAKVEQKIGLTDFKIEYSRPGKNDREIFGKLVPFDEVWRTGANENTKFTTSDAIIFGKDTLKAGTYALYTKPSKDSWDIIFYTEALNWGTPDKWDETKVALRTKAKVIVLPSAVETFTISFDNLETESANLNVTWDKTTASVAFTIPTKSKVQANIDKVMAGPSANDYYSAANFYLTEKKDLNKALEWINKAVVMRADAYWILRTKSLIQAELGDKTGAIETAKKSLEGATKNENQGYINMNNASIEEWSKK